MKDLEKKLRLLKISPRDSFRKNAKRRIFERIERKEHSFVIRLLKKIIKPNPDLDFIKLSRQNILQKINKPNYNYFDNFGFFWKKIVSFSLVLVLVFTFFYPFRNIEAIAENQIIDFQGEVFKKSLGEEWKKINSLEKILLGDKLKTKANSSLEIQILDNSIIRMDEETELSFSFIILNNFKNSPLINLKKGKIWSNILPQKDKTPFFVDTKFSRINTKYGVFDVEIDKKTRIRALQNNINIKSYLNKKNYDLLLEAGYETFIDKNKEVFLPLENLEKDKWVSFNQEKDKKFFEEKQKEEELELRENLGTLPNNAFYPVVNVLNKISLDDFEKIKKDLSYVKVLFLEDQEKALDLFKKTVKELKELKKEEKYKKTVKEFLEEEKLFWLKIFPNDKIFPLEEHFKKMFISLSENQEKEVLRQKQESLKELKNVSLQVNPEKEILVSSLETFIKNKKEEKIDLNKEKKDLRKDLEIQNKELKIITDIEKKEIDKDLKEKTVKIKQDLINSIQAIVQKIEPKTKIGLPKNKKQTEWITDQVKIMVNKINNFDTKRSKENTLYWILNDIENKKENISFLYILKESLPTEMKLTVSKKILDIKRK
jgi:hypothetical protein